jgi:chorismate synthase
MSANTFGQIFQIHSFGESHGAALGVVIDGCPAGVDFDMELLKRDLARRRPGHQAVVSPRKESDDPEILSGVFEGKTLGTPIAILVRNQDQRSKDYSSSAPARAGHADDVWKEKFGHTDYRGGGRSSGRETVARVMGGAVAKMFLQQAEKSLEIFAWASQIGPFAISAEEKNILLQQDASQEFIDRHVARFPSTKAPELEIFLQRAQQEGESYGGRAALCVRGMPQSLGQPVFHKLKSDLAQALLSIGATAGLLLGEEAQNVAAARGTEFHALTSQTQYGGVRGGISTGEDLLLEVLFKPTSSLLDVAKKGRHDPCIVPRAIPVIEAMTALVLADHVLWRRLDRSV